MDLRTFIIELLDKLIWPLTLITAFVIFRKQLTKLLPNFKKLKYGKLELEFQKELENIKQETSKFRNIGKPLNDDYQLNEILSINESYPRGAILQAWISLESSIYTTMRHFGLLKKDEKIPFVKLLQKLRDDDYINDDVLSIINRLRKLRNEIVHSQNISISFNEIEDFVILAREMSEEVVGEIARKNSGC
jgi:hypothetical protein